MSGDLAQPQQESPASSVDIAASVVQEAEQTAPDTGSPTDTGTTETATTTVDEKLSPAAEFMLKQGHKAKKQDGRDVWLPYGTVEKMLDRYVNEHRTSWDGRYSTLEKEAGDLRSFRDEFVTTLRGDPRAFLSQIATHDPRYASFLEQKIEQAQQATTDPMPQPDVDLGNGTKTYSPDGIAKLIAWQARQVVDERLKPYEQRDKAAQERAETERIQTAQRERVATQITEAKSWPKWADYEADILKKLQEDTAQATQANRRPSMSLKEAYLQVQVERLAADDTEKRAKWLEEATKAPKSTSVPQSRSEQTRTTPRTSAEIARAVVADLERGA